MSTSVPEQSYEEILIKGRTHETRWHIAEHRHRDLATVEHVGRLVLVETEHTHPPTPMAPSFCAGS